MTRPLWINDTEVQSLLDPAVAYDAVHTALTNHAMGKYIQPLKPYIRPRGREEEAVGGRYIAMPAYLDAPFSSVGIKWIASVPTNIERGIPRASGVIVLNSIETGEVTAIMECSFLSAYRTAAVAAIAFDYFAIDEPRTVALLGAGPIGEQTMSLLLAKPRDINKLLIFDIKQHRAQQLAESIKQKFGISVEVCESSEIAVRNANVVVCATVGSSGYLKYDWLTEGVLIICLSLEDPTEETFLQCKVVIDDWQQCNREEKLIHRLTKQGRFSQDKVYAELGEVIFGKKNRRTSKDERFLVSPMGMAIEDLSVASIVLTRAKERGIGTVLN